MKNLFSWEVHDEQDENRRFVYPKFQTSQDYGSRIIAVSRSDALEW